MSDIFLISARDLLAVKKSECWPKECMEAHGAAGRETTYIGSRLEDSGKVWDYYVDDIGMYWYSTRWREPDGRIISMEEHICPEKFKRKRHRR